MARTSTRDIIKVCADLAKLDRRAKEEVLKYLQDELTRVVYREPPSPLAIKPTTYPEGGEQ